MPELGSEGLEELQEDLRALLAELQGLLERSEEGARPVELDQPIGRVSRMDAIQQQSMIQAGRRSMQLRIRQVEAALRRVAQQEYGDCLSCGEPVGFARLKVKPEAPFCIACQGRREASAQP